MADFPEALPHGPPLEVADGIWCVRGSFSMGPGVRIPRTMTLVRDGDALTVINSVRVADPSVLTALGTVRHVVKLADGHGIDDPWFVTTFGANFWSLADASHPKLPRDRTLGPDAPVPDATVLHVGGKKPEAAIHLPRSGGVLITCDALQNHADAEGASWLGGVVGGLMGFKGGVIVAPLWRRNHALQGAALADRLAPLTAAPFEHLVTGHGPPVRGGAHAAVVAAIAAAAG